MTRGADLRAILTGLEAPLGSSEGNPVALDGGIIDRNFRARLAVEIGTAIEVDAFGQWVEGEVAREPLFDPAVAREPLFDPAGERIRG